MSASVPARLLAAGTTEFSELIADGHDLYWVEDAPGHGRRLMRAGRTAECLTPPPYTVESHVYGGGVAAATIADGTAYFVDGATQRVFRLAPGGAPEPLTCDDGRRYADLTVDRTRDRLLAVCEDTASSSISISAIPLYGGPPRTLVTGHDFLSAPRVSPDGSTLAYIAWDHPSMPWDSTGLYTVSLDRPPTERQAARLIAGGDGVAVRRPRWSPDGVLHFMSDRSGWWNIHTESGPVAAMTVEMGEPGAIGAAPYDANERHVVTGAWSGGTGTLLRIDRASGTAEVLLRTSGQIDQPRFAAGSIAYLGGSAGEPIGVWEHRPGGRPPRRLRRATEQLPDRVLRAAPESLSVPARDGGTTHGYLYRPVPARRPAPLVVMARGWPAEMTTGTYRAGLTAPLFWASRGYAVADLNPRGSNGYGRHYREALNGRLGELDVADAVDVVRFLQARGDVDPARVVIRGCGAAGFTVLRALNTDEVFAAGTAYHPWHDLDALVSELPGFYAHLLDRLTGAAPLPPLTGLHGSLLLVQGLADQITPARRTEALADDLRSRGAEVEFMTLTGEGHGLARPEAVARCLEAEAAFYAKALSTTR
ncbi:S9 family peptidase [Nonomuraea endophytica]|uniref:Dipeptidyl aminopeptidase/acylaminoacyl peptidase n=1 Tax=Nonomuraea endophytica TaxID=714136 RepID=A0A7W8A8G6_9ACTN|nr:prolyl oligopeptidase family serine peptidase [Nonomuraea endophytica]MBB5081493.1 dipeptidyl aminopeptidase/acylaminoacyl peptidase [Nonomuraea endophytica]